MEFISELLTSAIRLSTPITLAALGAVVCERSGIVNIAMEGLMLMGAFFATALTLFTGSPWIGLMGGIAAGLLFSSLHAWATVTLHLDHVISGAVINILGFGLTRYLMILFFDRNGSTDLVATSLGDFRIEIPLFSKIPIIGDALFNQTPIVFISFLLIILTAIFLSRTKVGLHIRAAGEHPMALETMGISVKKMRYFGVLYSGLMCGLAGSFLSIEYSRSFSEGMTAGRGFIALAANVSGGWSAIGAFIASLFFGLVQALENQLQLMNINIPVEFFHMFPYVAAVIAVAGLVRKSRGPADLGNDFVIEESA